ncbi:tetratricopeptide repeat protein 29 isoform X2 [Polypterus senegalus]|uniref:tetratricopeptide repeat protein 29 isoform X2 n=1 Tax=Polypterus senegalus TaxID=55291 RepID=UPI001962C541|nr:tetratricopeptide repeat protein 29 isoform X2 [Polypterus senegalus]
MSTLPAIPRQNVGLFPSINAPSSFTSQAKKTYRVFIKGKDPIRIPSWHEKLSKFSKSEIAAYRNSHKHNICIDMLSDGYHKSFSELFTLIQKWNASREAAGPGSAIWHQKSLEEQPDKLDQLQHFLTRAEEAQRAGQLEESTAKLIKVDGGKREAEAHSNMGRVHSEHGQLEKAAEHYEAFHHLTLGRAWKDETGRSYKSQACESLWRIYTLLADKMLENKEHEQAIKTLIKAFEMARETGDKKIEGEAAYRVGAAYNSSGDPETAITYLEMSMQIFTELGDKDGIGKTCQALAKAYESQGNIEETMKYLEQFVAVAESSEHSESLLEACMSLGEISNMRGQYERGFEYFEKAYDISKKLKDLKQIQKAQVYIGISKAHIMMATFSSHIKAGGRVNTESLLAWKDN